MSSIRKTLNPPNYGTRKGLTGKTLAQEMEEKRLFGEYKESIRRQTQANKASNPTIAARKTRAKLTANIVNSLVNPRPTSTRARTAAPKQETPEEYRKRMDKLLRKGGSSKNFLRLKYKMSGGGPANNAWLKEALKERAEKSAKAKKASNNNRNATNSKIATNDAKAKLGSIVVSSEKNEEASKPPNAFLGGLKKKTVKKPVKK